MDNKTKKSAASRLIIANTPVWQTSMSPTTGSHCSSNCGKKIPRLRRWVSKYKQLWLVKFHVWYVWNGEALENMACKWQTSNCRKEWTLHKEKCKKSGERTWDPLVNITFFGLKKLGYPCQFSNFNANLSYLGTSEPTPQRKIKNETVFTFFCEDLFQFRLFHVQILYRLKIWLSPQNLSQCNFNFPLKPPPPFD